MNSERPIRLTQALADWTDALGAEFVLHDESTVKLCETATFSTSQRVFAILRPADAGQVAECIGVANQHVIPMSPVSRGRNWGLGSRVPTSDAVVLDLSRLNRILSHDETFGSIRLQPGVTFAHVNEYLQLHSSSWFVPVIGGPPDASVVGNFHERGDGIGPDADRLRNIASLEVVLPTGARIHTGYERFGIDTALASSGSEPAGPALHGLFTQSNFGIVVEATLFLARRPKHLQVCTAAIPDGGLAAFVEALRPLAFDLQHAATITLWNGHKRNSTRSEATIPGETWFSTIGLYAPSRAMAEAQHELITSALQHVSAELQITDATPHLTDLSSLFAGVPTSKNIASMYAGKPSLPGDDVLSPERDGCGAVWICPEIPLLGETVSTVVSLCQRRMQEFGFLPILGMMICRGRTARLFISIFYDRDVQGADARASECKRLLQQDLLKLGCLPYRLGVSGVSFPMRAPEDMRRFLGDLQSTLDPNAIMTPAKS